jgi:ABC-type antimicrobial peptide transport system permease subunit
MIGHYLIIAWRNLLKYRTQSIISIVGLSIGFTAFVFTLSWIRYESGYDKHNPDAERIYRVYFNDSTEIGGVKKQTPKILAGYLMKNYPEIEAATSIYTYESDLNLNEKVFLNDIHFVKSDTSFFHVFYPEIRISFPPTIAPDSYLFTASTAQKLGLKEEQRGMRIDSLQLFLLSVVPDKPKQSNVPFDLITVSQPEEIRENAWGYQDSFTFIRVKEGINISLLREKLDQLSIENYVSEDVYFTQDFSCKLVPLTKLRTIYPDTEVAIRYQQLRLFAGVSLLVILSAFFNFLMLFINKIKIRHREWELHKVNGATNMQLLLMLFCEFAMLLLIALAIGLSLTELLYPHFIRFSMLGAPKSFFWREAILFGIALFALSALFSYIPVRYILRRTIRENLLQETQPGRKKERFSSITITLQLIISGILIFSTIVFFLQYSYINRKEIGFDRQNINTVSFYPNDIPIDEIKRVPGVEKVIRFGGDFLPRRYTIQGSVQVNSETEKMQEMKFNMFDISGSEYLEFFGLKLLEGRNIFEGEKEACLINETGSRLLHSIDSTSEKRVFGLQVVGVIADMYIDSPLIPVFPSIYRIQHTQVGATASGYSPPQYYAYRYTEGQRETTEQEINRLATEKFDNQQVWIDNMEETYAEYTKSERYLLILLSVMTGVAILIAVFGAYSIITLACRRRRKEIAIRKVNGATVREIIQLFLREYLLITLVACMVSFPAGVLVMQRWLEQYTRRVSMEWWLFAALLLLMVLLVLSSVLFQVVRAARENPSEVVKSE